MASFSSCTWAVEQLPGLPLAEANKMHAVGIKTTVDLLNLSHTPPQQAAIAHRLGIPLPALRKWRAMADLARLPTVGCVHCGLLLHGGIASVQQLSQTPAHRLHAQLLRFHVATLQRRDLCPTISEVQQWVSEAKTLSLAD
ncbi:DUF4332 domain-containing protein [Spirulina major CS-329]|uniref:DUF4332 domain-containing protein n=1 Tax=Spirulina TaxID=1154 RepID=UPI00232AF211|nr:MULTISPECIES: DUF4332 domain-containing protein [Spirulina]MDB9493715.1 DUF4332 domain-containing protein [Spirulina subsalsa CS-330]MDB9505430.1 DUF4332 domain-containing protein [Spirulina major CS-329]